MTNGHRTFMAVMTMMLTWCFISGIAFVLFWSEIMDATIFSEMVMCSWTILVQPILMYGLVLGIFEVLGRLSDTLQARINVWFYHPIKDGRARNTLPFIVVFVAILMVCVIRLLYFIGNPDTVVNKVYVFLKDWETVFSRMFAGGFSSLLAVIALIMPFISAITLIIGAWFFSQSRLTLRIMRILAIVWMVRMLYLGIFFGYSIGRWITEDGVQTLVCLTIILWPLVEGIIVGISGGRRRLP